jgi:hypothetical protein
VLEDQRRSGSRAISPNDVSLALVLQWGDFRYFTAGDLSGDEFQSSYYDIEKYLVKYLTGPDGPLENRRITVMKASHHGSEHSNHPNTLKSLKPDTIIVCCNIQKQVPSPIFLERLKTYLEDMKAIVVFTNSMKVFKADDRYPQLVALNDLIATDNVKFSGKPGEEQFASNLGIKCAVIRRRVQNGVPVKFAADPVKPHKKIKRSGYEILLMDRDPLDEKNIAATVKFRAYDMRRSWDIADASLGTITRNFTRQAKQIAHWLTNDTENRGTLGSDYIDKYYPGLRRTINQLTEEESKDENVVAGKLYDKILAMFNDSFRMTNTLFLPKTNTLTSDEKMTLRALMVDNSNQPKFNAAAMYFNRKYGYREWFDPEYAWNKVEAPEPFYDKGNKRPAGTHAPQDLRKAKKPKK